MTMREFLKNVKENFDITPETYRIIVNIVEYANMQGDPYEVLHLLLDDTIGISYEDIEDIEF